MSPTSLARLTIFLAASGILLPAVPAIACTAIRLISRDGSVVVGRTMEFGFDVDSEAVVIPAGTKISSSLANSSHGMDYTTKFGVVGANAIGRKIIVDGMNEKGLYVGTLYLPGYAGYADPAKAVESRSLAPEDYGGWLLANFASVQEVRAHYQDVTLVPNPIEELGGLTLPAHYIVQDNTGAAVVIEPIDGSLKIHDDPLGVLTNSPTFDWHITNLRNYINLSATNVPAVALSDIKLTQFGQGTGMLGLPGDFTPPSRFVRAVFFSQLAVKNKTADETVPQMFHLMNAFDIPRGAVREDDNGQVDAEYTVWTSVSDLTNRRWAFRTYKDQSIRAIDVVKALKAAGGKVKTIAMDSDQVILDASTKFQ